MREVLHVLGAVASSILSGALLLALVVGGGDVPGERLLLLVGAALFAVSTTAHVLALREGR